MQLGTVQADDGTTMAATLVNGTWRRLPGRSLSEFLRQGFKTEPAETLAWVKGVLPLPEPGKVICCGLNYGDHIAETGRDVPSHPTLFAKYADSLVGPRDDIILPTGLQVDWEAELAVVVGAELWRAGHEEASAAIFGYTVANDISVRDWQYRTLQWFQGKAWDRSTPVGPHIVTADEVDPAEGLDISCRVNGQEVQRSNTRTLVFDSAALLSYISTFTVLRPGDLVLTGTPGGVGVSRDPQQFLQDGDVVETEIADIGVLRNKIRFVDRPEKRL